MRVRAIGHVQHVHGDKLTTHAPGAEFSVNPEVGARLVNERHAVEIAEAADEAKADPVAKTLTLQGKK